ncbi:MAG: ABC transporter permease [Polyangiaceae bacterium]
MKRALRYGLRRLLWALVVVVGVASIAFVIAHLLPGDPARMLVGPQAAAKDVEHVREIYGLDQPASVRFYRYWKRLVHIDAAPAGSGEHRRCASPLPQGPVDRGHSFHWRKPVITLLAEKIPRSVELALAALAFQASVGIGLGTLAAARRGSRWDEMTMGATLVGVSAPTFLLGVVLQWLLAYRLGVLPLDGYGKTAAEQLASLVLPALTLGIYGTAIYARLTRDEMLQVLLADHVRTARAKGASTLRVLTVHGLRNAMVPIATLVVLDLGTMVGGAIVTEKLFRWPGVGMLAVDALLNRDGPVILGTVLFASVTVVMATLLLDLVYVLLEPRLRR